MVHGTLALEDSRTTRPPDQKCRTPTELVGFPIKQDFAWRENVVVRYHHTQNGAVMLIVLLFASILSGGAGYLTASSPVRWPLFAWTIGLAILAWLFSSLTVAVTERELHWYFGPGIWKYCIALAEIEDIRIVHNKWRNGFGIRIAPGLRMYNVSGIVAVELRLKSGNTYRIGTNDAEGLSTALKSYVC